MGGRTSKRSIPWHENIIRAPGAIFAARTRIVSVTRMPSKTPLRPGPVGETMIFGGISWVCTGLGLVLGEGFIRAAAVNVAYARCLEEFIIKSIVCSCIIFFLPSFA